MTEGSKYQNIKYALISVASAFAGGVIAKKMYARKLTLGILGGTALLYSVFKGCDVVAPKVIEAYREGKILETELMKEKLKYDFLTDSVRSNLQNSLEQERDVRFKAQKTIDSQKKTLESTLYELNRTKSALSEANFRAKTTQKKLTEAQKNLDDTKIALGSTRKEADNYATYIKEENARRQLEQNTNKKNKSGKTLWEKIKFW